MNQRTSPVKYGVALAAVFTIALSYNAQAKPRFEIGGSLNRDDRYPHTMDVRGWKKEQPVRPFRKAHKRPHKAVKSAGILAGIVAPLAAKATEIVSDCGARVISGVRHTFVAGTHRMSLHAFGRAVDISGPPSCILAHLRGWPGGYSTDYRAVRHTHVSYEPGGREWGARFAHHHRTRRVAHRRYRYSG